MTDEPIRRRRALRLGAGVLAAGFAGCNTSDDSTGGGSTPEGKKLTSPTAGRPTSSASSTAGGTTDGTPAGESATTAGVPDSVGARRVAQGFTSPLGLEIPRAGRRFVVDQPGQVYLQDSTGVRNEPFLDVSDRTVDVSGYSEQGLLGLAFHPEFEDNGRFFVRYSAPRREGTPENYSHTFVLSEFRADPNAPTADPDSEETVLEIPQPQGNHNAGAVTFGPDGYLYVAVGDGGAGNDQGRGHVSDWYGAVGGGNGQDVTENLLGSILRIDVDGDDEGGYAVPPDNPLVGKAGLDEQFAWGFRNPWRMSFGPEGRLFVGDVGQGAWEEVNVVEKGGNYGWNVKEATHCFAADSCPDEGPDGEPLRDPVIEYPHGGDDPVSGISVIAGYLYDGTDMPALDGRFVFADWRAGGRLFVATERDEGLWPTRALTVEAEGFGPNVLTFGRNPAGELFVCTTSNAGVEGSTGEVYRLTAP